MARARTRHLLRAFIGLSMLGGLSMAAEAAPILGETQAGQAPAQAPAGQTAAVPSAPAATPPLVSSKSTVLEFTILPSRNNPDQMETTIILQQGGDNVVCVNHASQDIIVRSYEARSDPFDPDIPSPIAGQDSGHTGELAGFNSKKLFIKPDTPDDRFDAIDEPFDVGGFEGVFKPDEVECDEILTEGETVCVDVVIRAGDCAVIQHAGLERELRLMLALNSVPIIAPAAGRPFDQQTGPVFGVNPPTAPGGGLPSGGVGAAPNFSGSFSGSGGGSALVTVPNVIGLPLTNAMTVITGQGLTVGTIAASQANNTGLLDGLFITTAFAQTFPENVTGESTVVDQVPPGGSQVAPGTSIDLVAQANAVPVPEPSTLSIFILGILLALAMYGYVHIRSRQAVGQP